MLVAGWGQDDECRLFQRLTKRIAEPPVTIMKYEIEPTIGLFVNWEKALRRVMRVWRLKAET